MRCLRHRTLTTRLADEKSAECMPRVSSSRRRPFVACTLRSFVQPRRSPAESVAAPRRSADIYGGSIYPVVPEVRVSKDVRGHGLMSRSEDGPSKQRMSWVSSRRMAIWSDGGLSSRSSPKTTVCWRRFVVACVSGRPSADTAAQARGTIIGSAGMTDRSTNGCARLV